MAAESFHFPFPSEDATSRQPAHRAPAPRRLGRLSRSGDAGRGRTVVAVAAGAVFFAGIGSAYMHESMTGMGSGSMSGSPASTSAAMSAPGSAPAPTSPAAGQMLATVPSAKAAPPKAPIPMPSADSGPERPGGPGKPVSTASTAPVAASSSKPSTHTASSSGSSSSSGVTSPARSGSSSSGSSTTRYSAVRSGDDFGVIAARYGVSPARIAALNPGLDSTQLTIGQSVRVR